MRVFVATVLAAVLTPSAAHAYCLTTTRLDFVPTDEQPCDTRGKPLYWNNRCVDVYVHDPASRQVDVATARSILAQSLAAWAGVRCPADPVACTGALGDAPSLAPREAGTTTCAAGFTKGSANSNVLAFVDKNWTHDPGTIALTTVSFRTDTGEILDADIEVDSDPATITLSADGAATGKYDVQSIITHESGHLLGISHTQPTHTEAVMRVRYEPGDTSMRTLAADDRCALCASAPPSRTVTCQPGTAPTCGTSTPPAETHHGGCSFDAPGDPWAPAGLALLALLVSRARRGTASARRSPGPRCTSCKR